jgi:hypothetical protein
MVSQRTVLWHLFARTASLSIAWSMTMGEVVLRGDRGTKYVCSHLYFSKHGFLPQYIILIPFNASHDKHVHARYTCTPMNVDNYASYLR